MKIIKPMVELYDLHEIKKSSVAFLIAISLGLLYFEWPVGELVLKNT